MMDNTATMVDWNAIDRYLTEAVTYYEKRAPQVSRWLDDLYARLFAGRVGERSFENVPLGELNAALMLRASDAQGHEWMQGNMAQNYIYKFRDRMGLDLTGWSDF